MTSEQSDYHAYLLRLWREGVQKPWRAELVSPHTGAKQHFADQGQLLTFLAELTADTGVAATGPSTEQANDE